MKKAIRYILTTITLPVYLAFFLAVGLVIGLVQGIKLTADVFYTAVAD